MQAFKSEILFLLKSQYFNLGRDLKSEIDFNPTFLKIKHSKRGKFTN